MEEYEFELWAQLPDYDDEIAFGCNLELDEEEAEALVEVLTQSGFETSEEKVAEVMPELHNGLMEEARLLAATTMALADYSARRFGKEVDQEDLFEEDLKNDTFHYQKPDDVDGNVDDEEGYADAFCQWQEWEHAKVGEMAGEEGLKYLRERYGIDPDLDQADYGYRLPDELVAEAMSKSFFKGK